MNFVPNFIVTHCQYNSLLYLTLRRHTWVCGVRPILEIDRSQRLVNISVLYLHLKKPYCRGNSRTNHRPQPSGHWWRPIIFHCHRTRQTHVCLRRYRSVHLRVDFFVKSFCGSALFRTPKVSTRFLYKYKISYVTVGFVNK